MPSETLSELTEDRLIGLLEHSIPGSSDDHKRKRITCLEELLNRIRSDSIKNVDACIDTLLSLSKSHGDAQPESSLIVDALSTLVKKQEGAFDRILSGLKGQEHQLFIAFSKLSLKVNHKKKVQAIKPLLNFIVSRDSVNSDGVKEVYECLLNLGNQSLKKEIVKEAEPHLDSLRIYTYLFSVKLCSEFAGKSLLTQMHKVLEKSMTGYYNAHHIEVERRLCSYFGRIGDPNSLPHLLKLLKLRCEENVRDKIMVISEILNSHPYLIDDVLDVLYDVRHEKKLVNAILSSLAELEKPVVNVNKLLSKIRIKYWFESPAKFYVKKILVRGGQSSKPVLFEMLKDDEKYEYALECLKEIGVSNEDLLEVFLEQPILQVYRFLNSLKRNNKLPNDLNTLWLEREKLGDTIPGKTNRLEHLLIHLFSSFNFVTMNVAPLQLQSVDVVSFNPETLSLLIIGCTTGILKDDLAKMDVLTKKMEAELPNLFDMCTVTPVVVCSEIAAISPSDAKYSRDNGICILQDYDISKLLEMLTTNRTPRNVLDYIEEHKWSVTDIIDED